MNDIRDAHHTLGKAYLRDGQYDEAITHFNKVLELDHDFVDAHCELCRAYLAQNALDNAEISALTAQRLAPNSPIVQSIVDSLKDAYYDTGITALNAARYSDAVESFQKTITFDAAHKEAYHSLALAYFGQHQLQEAKNAVQTALKIDPNYTAALSLLEAIDPNSSQSTPNNTDTPTTEKTEPVPNPDPVPTDIDKEMERGRVFLNNKQYPQAEAVFKKIIKAEPQSYLAHQQLGQTYLEVGALNDAKSEADTALRIRPDFRPAQELQNAIIFLAKREKQQQLQKKIKGYLINIAILTVCGFIAFKFGIFDRILPEKIPPDLLIHTTLEDPTNKNGYIDAGENVRLKLMISNTGGTAKELKVSILPKSIGGLRYQIPDRTLDIRKNGFEMMRIPMTADKQARTRKVPIEIQILDKNQIPLATTDFQLNIKSK